MGDCATGSLLQVVVEYWDGGDGPVTAEDVGRLAADELLRSPEGELVDSLELPANE
jgi:hypothetical protein